MADSVAEKLMRLTPEQLISVMSTIDTLISDKTTRAIVLFDNGPLKIQPYVDEERPKKKRGRPKKSPTNEITTETLSGFVGEAEPIEHERVTVKTTQDIQKIVRNKKPRVNQDGKIEAIGEPFKVGPRPNKFFAMEAQIEKEVPKDSKKLKKALYTTPPVVRGNKTQVYYLECDECKIKEKKYRRIGDEEENKHEDNEVITNGYLCNNCILKRAKNVGRRSK